MTGGSRTSQTPENPLELTIRAAVWGASVPGPDPNRAAPAPTNFSHFDCPGGCGADNGGLGHSEAWWAATWPWRERPT